MYNTPFSLGMEAGLSSLYSALDISVAHLVSMGSHPRSQTESTQAVLPQVSSVSSP